MTSKEIVIFYDEECELCLALKRNISQFDSKHRLRWYSLQQASVEKAYPHLPKKEMKKQIHVLESETYLYTGFAGIKRIIHEIPIGRIISPILSLPGANMIGHFIYQWIAKNRHHLGCTSETCHTKKV
ncbi:thiol-disulfide oxidoreductase DCC family protein [Aliibacillus thermotolerans]|uniref:Thiol-disulfide oxidoreductase DCC family protein n=1 Tax=Aliibacillus thermotolerans TaxID=1834418 RepID=A0ABW0U989_9BACI|nr:DUF393 domain-containing protein [Aliibacillus thermotolerans]MDA3129733.1 DUF393 domain-containing protein [Aliibacillus thermotolerans]